MNRSYCVRFYMPGSEDVNGIIVPARHEREALETAIYYDIPEAFGKKPRKAWVESVTYRNGKHEVVNNVPS